MKKNNKLTKMISFILVAAMCWVLMPQVYALDADTYGYVTVDIKSQANGLIYFDSQASANAKVKSLYESGNTTDYLYYDGKTNSARYGISYSSLTAEYPDHFGLIQDGEELIPYTYPAKTSGEDKEAIILQNGSAATITLPQGYYDKLYFVALTYSSNDGAEFTLSYADELGDVTESRTLYNTGDVVSGAQYAKWFRAIAGEAWNNGWGGDARIYAYTVDADETRILKSMTIDPEKKSTAILAVTGVMNKPETKEYVEELLAGTEESIKAEKANITKSVNSLVSAGVKREDIAGITALDSLERKYLGIDIKSRANGLIYFDSQSSAKTIVKSLYEKGNTTDYLYYDGAESSTRYGISYPGLIAEYPTLHGSFEYNGETVPFSYPAKTSGEDKEAIILQNGGAATITVPEGYYNKLYFVAVTYGSNDAADITVSYDEGEDEVVATTLYNKGSDVTGAKNIKWFQAIAGGAWDNSWAGDANIYAYEIDTDNTRMLKSITIDADKESTAILAITGELLTKITKSKVEKLLSGDLKSVNSNRALIRTLADTLAMAGIDKANITGIEKYENSVLKYSKIDIKSQANGLIYFDSQSSAKAIVKSLYEKGNTTDYLYYDGAESSTRYGIAYSGLIADYPTLYADFEYNGETVPFSYPAKTSGEDKEAIILQNGGSATITVPEGNYENLYFVAVTYGSNDAADITISYDEGENEIVAATLYNKGSDVTGAKNIKWFQAIAGGAWDNSWSGDANIYAYSVDTDETRTLKSITIDPDKESTAILAVTGGLYTNLTKKNLETKIASLTEANEDELKFIEETVKALVNTGVKRDDIQGIEVFDGLFGDTFGIMELSEFVAEADGNKIVYNGKIKNRLGEGTVRAVVALYKGEKLVEVKTVSEGSIAYGGTADIVGSFEGVAAGEYAVKVIAVSDMDSLKPLFKSIAEYSVTITLD